MTAVVEGEASAGGRRARVAAGVVPRLRDRWWALPVALVVAGAALPVFVRLTDSANLVRGQNDLPSHVALIEQFRLSPLRLPAPHLLLHLVAGSADLVGVDPLVAAVVLLTAAMVLTALAVTWWLGTDGVPVAVAAVAGVGFVMAESPAVLAFGSTRLGVDGYIPLHTWNGPTSILMTGLAIALFAVCAVLLRDDRERTWDPPRALLVALAVANALAKPSFLFAVVPAFAVWALWHRRRDGTPDGAVVRRLLRDVAAPMVVTFVVQLVALYTVIDPMRREGVVWDPMSALALAGAGDVRFWLVLLLPAVALAVVGRDALDDPAFGTAVLTVVVAFVPFALLDDAGWRRGQLNVGQLAHLAALISVVASLRLLVVRWGRFSPARRVVVAVALALYLVAGTWAWSTDLGLVGEPPRRSSEEAALGHPPASPSGPLQLRDGP